MYCGGVCFFRAAWPHAQEGFPASSHSQPDSDDSPASEGCRVYVSVVLMVSLTAAPSRAILTIPRIIRRCKWEEGRFQLGLNPHATASADTFQLTWVPACSDDSQGFLQGLFASQAIPLPLQKARNIQSVVAHCSLFSNVSAEEEII
ncbi:hypothetical protein ACRRTK_011110 [Alexandromys fortis]